LKPGGDLLIGVLPNIRSIALHAWLKAANIPFKHGGEPGELRD